MMSVRHAKATPVPVQQPRVQLQSQFVVTIITIIIIINSTIIPEDVTRTFPVSTTDDDEAAFFCPPVGNVGPSTGWWSTLFFCWLGIPSLSGWQIYNCLQFERSCESWLSRTAHQSLPEPTADPVGQYNGRKKGDRRILHLLFFRSIPRIEAMNC